MIEGFAVVIPTLQRSRELRSLVQLCSAHPLVDELLIVNNSPEPIDWAFPKMRVSQQASNIFVNPAWNLGVRETAAPWLAIINDDVLFPASVFDKTAEILRKNRFGMVMPDWTCFSKSPTKRKISYRPAGDFNMYRGTFMAMRREHYVPIPEEMRIWGGDDWLYLNQRLPPAALVNVRFETEMFVTTREPQFQAMWSRDREFYERLVRPLLGTRWWHRPAMTITHIRRAAAKMRALRPENGIGSNRRSC